MLNDSVAILSCCQIPLSFFGNVIFPLRRINKKAVIIEKVMIVKKSCTFPEYIKNIELILPMREAINKMMS